MKWDCGTTVAMTRAELLPELRRTLPRDLEVIIHPYMLH